MYTFREEKKPRFNLLHAALITLIMAWLFVFLSPSAQSLFALSPEEVALLEEQREEQMRDLVFRFQEAPEDEDVPDAKFASDADRLRRAPVEEAPDEEPDPFSEGDTYELSNSPSAAPSDTPSPTVPPSPLPQPLTQPAIQPTPETQLTEARPESRPQQEPEQQPEEEPEESDAETEDESQETLEEALPDEPVPLESEQTDPESEPSELEGESRREEGAGEIELPPDAPKPYRKLTREELLAARREAMRDVDLTQANSGRTTQGTSYNNPRGSTAPNLGAMTVETNRSDLGAYLKILRQLVKANWRIPNIARYEVAGVTGISFLIHKDGTISDVQIALSSRFEPLDVAALNAINNTSPPPLPDFVEEETVPIKFGFYYNMRPNY